MKASSLKIVAAFFIRLFFRKIDYSLVVFSSTRNRYYDYNAKYLFEYMAEQGGKQCFFVMNDAEKREKLRAEIGDRLINTHSFKGALKVFTAGFWVISAGLPIMLPFAGRKRYILNVSHGMPFKKSEHSKRNDSSLFMRVHALFYKNNYRAISSSSSFFKPYIAETFRLDAQTDVVKTIGQIRDDIILQKRDKKEILERCGYGDIDPADKLIFYTATYRDNRETRRFPFEDFDLDDLNRWLVAHHSYILMGRHKSESGDVTPFLGDRIRLLDESIMEDITEALPVMDLLITDYSNILYLFLITEKPCLFLPYDYALYREERGFCFDYETYAVGPKPETYQAFKIEIEKLFSDPNYYLPQRKEANAKFHEVLGDSRERHARLIYETRNLPPKVRKA